jgi:hypothetical protein
MSKPMNKASLLYMKAWYEGTDYTSGFNTLSPEFWILVVAVSVNVMLHHLF